MRRHEIFWGAVLLIAGILLLVGNFFSINVWQLLWPLFLIALGGWILWGTLAGPEPVEAERLSLSTEQAKQAQVHLKYGAGELRVEGPAETGVLVEGSFGGGVRHELNRHGDDVDLELQSPANVWTWPWAPHERRWSLRLAPDLDLQLDVESGASDNWLDLTDLHVSRLQIETGASATKVRLPANVPEMRVDVDAGAASVDLRVPEGVAARIRTEVGLSSVSIDKTRFPPQGAKRYQSPDYETATRRIDIMLEGGVGSMSVR
jgi:hypothetical protein